jgi:hypothetical protein
VIGHWGAAALLAAALAGCGPPSAERVSEEASRLRKSFEKRHPDYLQSIEGANELAPETLAWLDGAAITAPRAQAVSDAHRFAEKWARVYFGPRYMHEQLRFDEYSAPEVHQAQGQALDHLKRWYFELHDYQRYAQHAAESSMHGAPPGVLPPQLQEFRRRLQARARSVDEITPVLESLPTRATRRSTRYR